MFQTNRLVPLYFDKLHYPPKGFNCITVSPHSLMFQTNTLVPLYYHKLYCPPQVFTPHPH